MVLDGLVCHGRWSHGWQRARFPIETEIQEGEEGMRVVMKMPVWSLPSVFERGHWSIYEFSVLDVICMKQLNGTHELEWREVVNMTGT